MKKIFLMLVAAAMTALTVSAQDMAQATENYNNGAMELQMGNKEAALGYFQTALTMAEALGDEGVDIVTNCKNTIPALMASIGKDLVKAENFDAAIEQFNKTIEVAESYGNTEVVEEAKTLIPQVLMSKAGDLLNAKDFAAASAAYQQVLDANPENGMAALRLGMALAAQGKTAEAEAAYVQAAANGQEANANQSPEHANAYRFAASASQQLGKNADCIANYEKYLELSPNAKDANGVKFTIAALYQQAGNNAKAKEYYQAVVSDPQFGASAQEQLKAL